MTISDDYVPPQDPVQEAGAAQRVAELERRAKADALQLDFPARRWVPTRYTADENAVLNVLVVGGGQAAISIMARLKRDHVDAILAIDHRDEGREGPWLSIARMRTLRTPKELTGPDTDLPSLTFRSWYEARFGVQDWSYLEQIPRQQWAEYLAWVRGVHGVPFRNNTTLERIETDGACLAAHVRDATGPSVLRARKIVLATGVDGAGGWHVPPRIASMPSRLWAHTADSIDFKALRGKRVAVVGAGASAMDAAATALENGAAAVDQLCRRRSLQSIQPIRWSAFPGFMRHIGEMPDAWRWRFMSYMLELREPFTKDAWQRVSGFSTYRMLLGVDSDTLRGDDRGIRMLGRDETYDFLICGTGIEVDHRLRPELAAFADDIATWGDRYVPPPAAVNDRLARYPYLTDGFAYTEKTPGRAPQLRNLHCFNFGASLSMGPSGAAVRPLKYAAPRLVRALTRDLFEADLDHHWREFQAFTGMEFDSYPCGLESCFVYHPDRGTQGSAAPEGHAGSSNAGYDLDRAGEPIGVARRAASDLP